MAAALVQLIHEDDHLALFHGDCREALKELPDNYVDAIVTDPPYELGFMGKGWDSSGIAYDVGRLGVATKEAA